MGYFRKTEAIGFSTGALSKGDLELALESLAKYNFKAIELSALRENELSTFKEIIITNSDYLKKYRYVSFHVPSKLSELKEMDLVEFLSELLVKEWMFIVHPNIIKDYSLWNSLDKYVCIENMDKRSSFGTNFSDFKIIFSKLPKASLCFDLAHSYQVDPSLKDAEQILKTFKRRLKQVHISKLDEQSKHLPLTSGIMLKFRKIIKLIPHNVPIIIESPVDFDNVQQEFDKVYRLFCVQNKIGKAKNEIKRSKVSHVFHSLVPKVRKK